MGEKIHNNHFIQKGFVKEFFGGVKNVGYVKLGTNEYGNIRIDSYSSAIVKKDFHSDEIETGMNLLECQGLDLIKKINKQMDEGQVKLNRIETMTLRFYLLLGLLRSSASRNDIETKNGDSLFNKVIAKDSRSAIKIQEDKVAELLKMYKDFKEKKDFNKALNQLMIKASKSENANKYIAENLDIKLSVHMTFQESVRSRLIFFEFDEGNLMLQEKLSFQEISKINSPRSIYNFFPINKTHGIMLVNKSSIERELGSIQEQSKVFKEDLTSMHTVNYKNADKMRLALFKSLCDNHLEFNRENEMKWNIKHTHEFYADEDEYTYDVKLEPRETLDFCNAMMSVHNNGAIAMYVSPDDIRRMYATKEYFGIFDLATGKG